MRKLPGVQPIGPDDWLMCDDAFPEQMAYADHLIATHRAQVSELPDTVTAAAQELLSIVMAWLRKQPDYHTDGPTVTRPDGVTIDTTSDHALIVARRLVQEDLLLHVHDGQEHVLTGGVLTFPASWTLAQKVGRPLSGVHDPVKVYDTEIAARVQRLFNGLKSDRPLMRGNFLTYHDADLYQPRTEEKGTGHKANPRFLRMERQCLVRLPKTDAVLFSIHTFVLPLANLPDDDRSQILDQKNPVGS